MRYLSLKNIVLLIMAVTIFKLSGYLHALNYSFWSWAIVTGIGWFILNIMLDRKDD